MSKPTKIFANIEGVSFPFSEGKGYSYNDAEGMVQKGEAEALRRGQGLRLPCRRPIPPPDDANSDWLFRRPRQDS